MSQTNLITILAVKLPNGELVPFYDNRISHLEDDYFGDSATFEGKRTNLIECTYNLKTKQIEPCVELNYYEHSEEFTIGQTVYYEHQYPNKGIEKTTITDIVYDTFTFEIKKGSKLESYERRQFPNVEINPKLYYLIKSWKPYYQLDNGVLCKYEMYLKTEFVKK